MNCIPHDDLADTTTTTVGDSMIERMVIATEGKSPTNEKTTTILEGCCFCMHSETFAKNVSEDP